VTKVTGSVILRRSRRACPELSRRDLGYEEEILRFAQNDSVAVTLGTLLSCIIKTAGIVVGIVPIKNQLSAGNGERPGMFALHEAYMRWLFALRRPG
jgi:hypothetical protein